MIGKLHHMLPVGTAEGNQGLLHHIYCFRSFTTQSAGVKLPGMARTEPDS
jgi:hypothetical protein